MGAHYTSDISFSCPKCYNRVSRSVDVPEPNWSGDNADERFTYDTDSVKCDACGTWYDLTVENQDLQITARLLEHPEVSVDATDAELMSNDGDDYWEDYEPPSDPDDIAYSVLVDILELLDKHGDKHRPSVLNRMVFSQQVAVMEAYLGDTLQKYVRLDPKVLLRIVTDDKDLKDHKLGLLEILSKKTSVETVVIHHLKEQLYHNLPKVRRLYQIAFGTDLAKVLDKDVWDRLNKAMPIRHDCVHRNGNTKEGDVRMEVTAPFVRQMHEDILALIGHVEGSIQVDLNL